MLTNAVVSDGHRWLLVIPRLAGAHDDLARELAPTTIVQQIYDPTPRDSEQRLDGLPWVCKTSLPRQFDLTLDQSIEGICHALDEGVARLRDGVDLRPVATLAAERLPALVGDPTDDLVDVGGR